MFDYEPRIADFDACSVSTRPLGGRVPESGPDVDRSDRSAHARSASLIKRARLTRWPLRVIFDVPHLCRTGPVYLNNRKCGAHSDTSESRQDRTLVLVIEALCAALAPLHLNGGCPAMCSVTPSPAIFCKMAPIGALSRNCLGAPIFQLRNYIPRARAYESHGARLAPADRRLTCDRAQSIHFSLAASATVTMATGMPWPSQGSSATVPFDRKGVTVTRRGERPEPR